MGPALVPPVNEKSASSGVAPGVEPIGVRHRSNGRCARTLRSGRWAHLASQQASGSAPDGAPSQTASTGQKRLAAKMRSAVVWRSERYAGAVSEAPERYVRWPEQGRSRAEATAQRRGLPPGGVLPREGGPEQDPADSGDPVPSSAES